MIGSTLGLIKVWLITTALTNPLVWVGLIILFSVVNLFLAIFVKFKNGFVSLVCFILCETVGVIALTSLLYTRAYYDDLYLDEGVMQQISEVTPSGVVYRKWFRNYTEPLLGIELPESGKYFEQARENILNARFADSLYMYKSSAYTGVVLCDSEKNSINEQLLYDGLAKTTVVTPKQYIQIQQGATKHRRGMWEIAAAPIIKPHFILEFTVVWLVLILCVCTSLSISKWLKEIIKIYAP